MIDIELCNRVAKVRKMLDLTQVEFANKTSASRSLIAQIEKHHSEPSKKLISNIVMNLNINANWLLTGKGEMFTEEYTAKVDADFQESLDWMIEFCRSVADGEIEQTPEIEETLKIITKITKLVTKTLK